MAPGNPTQTSPPRRVLLYTHNAIGLGHVFRSLAVITGMRPWAPHWDFLVVSGSSIPQAFLAEGIEVLKLPGVRMTWAASGPGLQPRHLASLGVAEIFALRTRLIADAVAGFAPDIVMVEHNMTGLMNELAPVLQQKRSSQSGGSDFALVHLCRGILSAYPHPPGLPAPAVQPLEVAELAGLYDFIYVFDDRQAVAGQGAPWQNRPELAERIAFLGRIGIRNRAELPAATVVKRAWGLDDAPLVLFSLGRVGPVAALTQALAVAGLPLGSQLAVMVDPYLAPAERESLARCAGELGARLLGFTPYLVELINAAELLICRAGYNIFNEALLCGVRALFVPENHGGLEQERRVARLSGPHQAWASEAEVLDGRAGVKLAGLLRAPRDPDPPALDRFAAGRRIVGDLQQWLARRSRPGGAEPDHCHA
ncbi:MAG: glycosyltransferase [Pseudomonadota bacterium]